MIPVYRAAQIRAADEYTIIHTPIASIDLMEKAAWACTDKILEIIPKSTISFIICCGPGNNGGDGLAIARMLLEKAFQVKVVLVGKSDNAADHQLNKTRLLDLQPDAILESYSSLNLSSHTILIDALFGTGLNKAPSGDYSNCIQWMNQQQVTRISIDIPSGLWSDTITHHADVVQAHHTLSFEFYKPGFLFAESGAACGIIHILSIGLLTHEAGLGQPYALMLEASDFRTLLSGRSLFAHKGDFGKVLLVGGHEGSVGAALLAGRAALRTGCGLLTIWTSPAHHNAVYMSIPEAMTFQEAAKNRIHTFDAVGIGPGLGQEESALYKLNLLLQEFDKPMVLDADALNLLAKNPEWIERIPTGSILTPHVKEFERLTGCQADAMERHQLQIEWSVRFKLYIVLKGRYTSISTPDGRLLINQTGNPGMAKGGSGDTLIGIITACLGRFKSPEIAATLGVYLHGLAGDLACDEKGEESMLSSDLIEKIPAAYRALSANNQV